jgi:hypothetical protein
LRKAFEPSITNAVIEKLIEDEEAESFSEPCRTEAAWGEDPCRTLSGPSPEMMPE